MNSHIKLHYHQSLPFRYLFDNERRRGNQMRFAVVCASRGFGKTILAATSAIAAVNELEQMPSWVKNKNVAIICGTHEQTSDIYRPLLQHDFQLEKFAKMVRKPHLRFEFPNGTLLKCYSADSIHRMRGMGNYFVIADEFATWDVKGGDLLDAWESIIMPTIDTRWSAELSERMQSPSAGKALLISTPDGRNAFFDLYIRSDNDSRWKSWLFNYKKSPYLSKEEIERTKKNTDPLKFAREYEASFEESGLQVFYSFDRKKNVKKNLKWFEPGETVFAAIDFNIMVNATSFCAIRGDELHVLDELRGANSTQDLVKQIRQRFPNNDIMCLPDPSGKARSTKAPVGQTDFTILREAGFGLRSRKKAPSVLDSAAAVNRKLNNANHESSLFIHPRCNEVIKSLERTVWNERVIDSATIDKSNGVEHFSDGIRYIVEYHWPIRGSIRIYSGSRF